VVSGVYDLCIPSKHGAVSRLLVLYLSCGMLDGMLESLGKIDVTKSPPPPPLLLLWFTWLLPFSASSLTSKEEQGGAWSVEQPAVCTESLIHVTWITGTTTGSGTSFYTLIYTLITPSFTLCFFLA
jgi:hypothetical protein